MSTLALNLDFYESALRAKADECREVVLNARQDIWSGPEAEAMDQSLDRAEREMVAERMERCYRILRQVETALLRLERGRYGLCLKCEESIEQKRLDALPWALFCIDCQDRIDSRQGGPAAKRQAA